MSWWGFFVAIFISGAAAQTACHSLLLLLTGELSFRQKADGRVHFEALSLEFPLSILSQHLCFVSLVTNLLHAIHSISVC